MKNTLLLLLIFLQSCMLTESISDSTMNQPILSNYLDEFSKDYIVKSKEIAFRDTNSTNVITIQFISINKKLSVISGIGRTGGKAFLVNKGDQLQFLFTDGTVANITFEESKVSEYNINQIGYYIITHYYALIDSSLDENVINFLSNKTIKRVRFNLDEYYVQVNTIDKSYSDKINLFVTNFMDIIK